MDNAIASSTTSRPLNIRARPCTHALCLCLSLSPFPSFTRRSSSTKQGFPLRAHGDGHRGEPAAWSAPRRSMQ
eukprot:scaffold180_cov311-Pinguiococcus_pyrenoidosus.AAC.52